MCYSHSCIYWYQLFAIVLQTIYIGLYRYWKHQLKKKLKQKKKSQYETSTTGGTHKSSLPQVCLGPPAVPTGVATPPRTVQSTCGRQNNNLQWEFARSTISNPSKNQYHKVESETAPCSLKQSHTQDPTWRRGSDQAQPTCRTRRARRGRRRRGVTDRRRRASWAPVWLARLPTGPGETAPPAPSSAAAAPSPPAAAAPAAPTFSPPSGPDDAQPQVSLQFTSSLSELLQWHFEVLEHQLRFEFWELKLEWTYLLA